MVYDNELESDLEKQHFYIVLKFENLQQTLYNLLIHKQQSTLGKLQIFEVVSIKTDKLVELV